ncbi:organic cation transporter protein-like [Mercenaria mercenaria]|uniref:organic cation transporter protein-like n=1 Tax=Mercenaria mercenaria TaxID=6596 RepID=UPI00234F2744|nr:organic cation transporter protein-like [Mercenaria mercenaria]
MPTVEDIDVDKIWRALGKWGSYQRRQFIIELVAIWSCSLHMLSIVFLGFKPDHECKDVLNASRYNEHSNLSTTRLFEKCSITYITNETGKTTVTKTGCANGWTYHDSGPFPEERSFISEWDLVCEKKELAEVSQTLLMLGQGVGALVFTSLSDRYGRKRIHIICHVIIFAVALATAFVPNFTLFAIMRMLTGAFQQLLIGTLSLLLIEMVPTETRGTIEVCSLLFWTTGIAIVTPVAYIFRNLSWRYLQICLACLSSWSLIEWWLIDESLRWLIANGRIKDAKAVIHRACKTNKKNYDDVVSVSGFREFELRYETKIDVSKGATATPLTDMEKEETGENEEKEDLSVKQYTVIDLVKSKRLFISSLIMWLAWTTNSITYYGIMLISSSLAGNRFLNFFLGSIVEYPAAAAELYLITRYGRKPASIIFHSICGTALIIATILTTSADGNSAMVIGSTVFTLIGKFAITGSFSTIFLYTHELYPTNMRNVGVGMASTAARIGGMVAPFSRNLAEVAAWAPGLVFGVLCAIVAVSMFWIPETHQYELPQTLEECEQWYKENRFKLPCNRKKIVHITESEQQM